MNKIHPELAAQLEETTAPMVQAVVQLRPTDGHELSPSPEESSKLADEVLQRVEKKVGHAANRVNVLRNVATLIVEADPDFVRSLLKQPEVVSALPNVISQNLLIEPNAKRPV
jgi:hypothetical protein